MADKIIRFPSERTRRHAASVVPSKYVSSRSVRSPVGSVPEESTPLESTFPELSAAISGSGASRRPLYTRREARTLLCRATRILANLGDRERRISWILEDCVDLLSPESEANQEDQQTRSSTV